MRFWISRTEGEVEGPFDIDTLKSMLAEGSITLQTQACAENSENWIPLGHTAPFRQDTSTDEGGQSLADTPTQYTFNGAFSLGWHIFTSRYGIVLGVTLFMLLAAMIPSICTTPVNMAIGGNNSVGADVAIVQLAGGCFSWAWAFLVSTPVSIGGFWVIVRILRGHQDASFSDIWAPFKHYGWILLAQLLITACTIGIVFIGTIAGGVPGVLIGLLVGGMTSDPTTGIVVGVLVGMILLLLVAYYFSVRIMATYVLVIDTDLGFPNPADALVMSWKRTQGRAWSLVGLGFVLSLIATASFFACFFPLMFFGQPLLVAVSAAAYVLLFPGAGLSGARCPSCGYAMAPGSAETCPECGAAWKQEPETGTA